MIDIRKALASLAGIPSGLFPTSNESLGFQWYGIRQPDYTKKCSCSALLGSSGDPACTRCLNTGYLFTDYLVKGYSWLGILGFEYGTNTGVISTQNKIIVLQHNRQINKFDHILELDQEVDTGKVKQPFKITKYYRVQDVAPLKGDSARIEFWKCSIEERNIDDGRPGQLGSEFTYKVNRLPNDLS